MEWIQANRVIDFSLSTNDQRNGYVSIIAKEIVATAATDPDSVANLLHAYLRIHEHTVFGLTGDPNLPLSLAGLLVMTPLKEQAFFNIMSGHYQFLYQGKDVYLPKVEDVVPYRDSEAVLVAAIGYASPNDRGVFEMIRYARGSFLVKSAWKRTIDIVCLSERGKELDPFAREFLSGPVVYENFQNYRTNLASVGPIWKPEGKNPN